MSGQCDSEIYKNGKVVAMLSGQSRVIEGIIVSASKQSGVKMDWHYCCGRGVVKTVGDVDKAALAIKACMPELLDT